MREPRIYQVMVPRPGTVERVDAPLIDPAIPARPVPGEPGFDELLHPTSHRLLP